MTTAGIVLSRHRLVGIGQAITMPLFFGSNALHPVSVMPGRLQAVSEANPLGCEVDALGPAGPSGPLIFTRGSDVRHARESAFSVCFRITAGHGLITDQKG